MRLWIMRFKVGAVEILRLIDNLIMENLELWMNFKDILYSILNYEYKKIL